MSFLWLIVCLSSALLAEGQLYGNLYTCGVQYVKPGSDFQIPCKSDYATDTRVRQYFPRFKSVKDIPDCHEGIINK